MPALPARDLGEIACVFLRLGLTAFGGPAAHIALMEDEFVRRRAWLTRDEFLDRVGAAGLIPGPSSTEVAILVGYRRGGVPGLLVAGVGFIVPAALMVTAIAWAYVTYGVLPGVAGVLYGVKAVVLGVIAQALLAFGKTCLTSKGRVALAAVALAAAAFGVSPILVLVASGALYAVTREAPSSRAQAAEWLGVPTVAGLAGSTPVTLPKLFLVFLKVGSVVFGSGYVLLAFLRDELVHARGWLTEAQLLDAVAVGQFTPGPVFTTATFIGYVVARGPGAVAATVAIFLPAFVLVGVSGPLLPRLRASKRAGAFLDGVNVASLALMALVLAELGRSAIVDARAGAMAVASAFVLLRWRVNSAWVVLAGGALGAMR